MFQCCCSYKRPFLESHANQCLSFQTLAIEYLQSKIDVSPLCDSDRTNWQYRACCALVKIKRKCRHYNSICRRARKYPKFSPEQKSEIKFLQFFSRSACKCCQSRWYGCVCAGNLRQIRDAASAFAVNFTNCPSKYVPTSSWRSNFRRWCR